MDDIRSWIEQPTELVHNWEIVPQACMTKAELLNAMTRLILIITLILFLIGVAGWWLFLILSICLIFIIWYTTIRETNPNGMRVEWYRVPKPRKRRTKYKRTTQDGEYRLNSR